MNIKFNKNASADGNGAKISNKFNCSTCKSTIIWFTCITNCISHWVIYPDPNRVQLWPHKKQWLHLHTRPACNLVIFVSNQYSSNWTHRRAQLNIFQNSIVCSMVAHLFASFLSKLSCYEYSNDSSLASWWFPQRHISLTCGHSPVFPPSPANSRPMRVRGGNQPIRNRIQHVDWIVRILDSSTGIFDISIMLLMIHQ